MYIVWMICYIQVAKHSPEIEEDVENGDVPAVSNPVQMTIEIRSADVLEMTISKTALEVLTNLGKV